MSASCYNGCCRLDMYVMSCLCYAYVWHPYSGTHTRLCCLSWKAGAQSGLLSASNTQPYSMLLFLLQWRYLSDSAPTSTLHQAGEFLRFQSAWYCAAGLQLALVVLQQQQYVAAGCTAALVVSIPCCVLFSMVWSSRVALTAAWPDTLKSLSYRGSFCVSASAMDDMNTGPWSPLLCHEHSIHGFPCPWRLQGGFHVPSHEH